MTVFFESNSLDMSMYSIDFNEGAVALSYPLLEAEVNFTVACIQEISKRHPNQQIIILAHSFGGVVGSLALQHVPRSLIKGLVTLGTPFKSPPVNSDLRMIRSYDRMYKVLNASQAFLISITGGIRDLVVPSGLTNLDRVSDNYLHVYSTSIEGLHKEIDHVAMVWGQEFFEQLVKVLKICSSSEGSQVISKVRQMFISDFSEFTQKKKVNESQWLVRVDKSTEGGKLGLEKGLELHDSVLYIVDEGKLAGFGKDLQKQEFEFKDFDFSLPRLVIGTKVQVETGKNLGLVFRAGRNLAEPRYPLHIRVIGEGQVQAVLARCGHEEIVKYNENDFVLFFHERCEEGPEIWMMGFDLEYDYEVEIFIDFIGMLVSMVRDFRLHMFTAMFYFIMVEILTGYENRFVQSSEFVIGKIGLPKEVFINYLISFGFMIGFGQDFKNLGMSYLVTFVSDEKIGYGVIDIAFICATGFGLKTIFNVIFEFIVKVNRVVKVIAGSWVVTLAVLPLFYYMPWPVMIFLLVSSTAEVNSLKVGFIAAFSVLPQIIGWHIAYLTHGILEFDLNAVPVVIFLLASRISKLDYRGEVAIASFALGIWTHDHLFKVAILFQGLSLISSLRHVIKWFRKSNKRKTN